MKLAALKVFVPGKTMLVFLIAVGLAALWYYVEAQNRGEHLARRNFHHLNQLDASIGSSLKTLDSVVRFGDHSCNERVKDALAKATAETPKKAARDTDRPDIETPSTETPNTEAATVETPQEEQPVYRWLDDFGACMLELIGPKGRRVAGGVITSFTWQSEKAQESKTGQKDSATAGKGDEDQGKQGTPVDRHSATLDRPSTDRRSSIDPDCRSVGLEEDDCQLSLDSIATSLSAGLVSKRYRWLSEGGHKGTANVTYDVLQRFDLSEGYFDFVAIAQYPAGNGSDSDASASVVSIAGASLSALDAANVRKLFKANHQSARFRTLYDLELTNAAADLSLLNPGSGAGRPLPEPRQFDRSAIVPVTVADTSYFAFVQPMSAQFGDDTGDLVIVGFVQRAEFNQKKFALSYNLLYLVLLALALLVLVYSLLHLYFIGQKEVLLRRNALMASLSILGLQAVLILLFVQIVSSAHFSWMFNEAKTSLFGSIRDEFGAELQENLDYLSRQEDAILAQPRKGEQDKLELLEIDSFESMAQPLDRSLFKLDCDGKQVGTYLYNKRKSPAAGFDLATRDYFRRVRDGTAWTRNSGRGAEDSAADTGATDNRFFVERILSRVDGVIQSAVSKPASGLEDSIEEVCARRGDAGGVVSVLVTDFMSLRNPVLPAGYDFAVFDNLSGEVMFHSRAERTLHENFYRASSDSDRLKAAVIAAVDSNLTLNYKGEVIKARVGPLQADIPWTLALYYRKPVPDVVKFHFGVAGAILVLVHLLLTLVAVVLMLRLLDWWVGAEAPARRWRERIELPRWMCPSKSSGARYRRLNAQYLSVVPLYLGVMFFVDSFVWFWYFTGPLSGLMAWHLQLNAPLYQGSSRGRLLARLLRLWFALNIVTAIIVLIAVGAAIWALIGIAWLAYWLRRGAAIDIEREAPDSRANLRGFGTALAFYGLLASVVPTLILQNQNYDIHERLWIDFNHWSNVDRLKARFQRYRETAGTIRYPADLRQYLLHNWRGVYLPRAELLALSGSDDLTPLTRHTRERLLASSLGGEYDRYYLFARAIDSSGTPAPQISILDTALSSKPLILSGEDLRRRATTPFYRGEPFLGASLRRWWRDLSEVDLRGITYLAPNFSEIEELLEGLAYDEFEESEAPASAERKLQQVSTFQRCVHRDGKIQCSGQEHILDDQCALSVEECRQLAPDKRAQAFRSILQEAFHGALFRVDTDLDAGIEYSGLYWFPHTRPLQTAPALILFGLFTALVGWASRRINLGLMARFFYDISVWPLRRVRVTPALPDPATPRLLVVPVGRDAASDLQVGEDDRRWPWHSPAPCWRVYEQGTNHFLLACFQPEGKVEEMLPTRVLDEIRQKLDQSWSVIIAASVDLEYWLREHHEEGQLSDDCFQRWMGLMSRFETSAYDSAGRQEGPEVDPADAAGRQRRMLLAGRRAEDCWDYYGDSTEDERMLLAGLRYEQRINPRNRPALRSLVRRGLITHEDYEFAFSFVDPALESAIETLLPEENFRAALRHYGNSRWLQMKKPLILGLTLLALFILFVARDQVGGVFTMMAAVGTGLATLSMVGERIRQFSTLFFARE